MTLKLQKPTLIDLVGGSQEPSPAVHARKAEGSYEAGFRVYPISLLIAFQVDDIFILPGILLWRH